MATFMGSVLLSFSCLGFACEFNFVQRCLSIVTVVASGCHPVVSSRIGRRLGSSPREQQPRTSHHRADAGPCIDECFILVSLSLCF
jgi:hypothetical protein